jgi:hypothetical protein
MTRLDLDFDILNVDGSALKEKDGANLHAARLLATIIASSQLGDPIKFFDIAQALHKTGKVELDKSDLNKVKEFVQGEKSGLTVLSRAQILSRILDAEKDS